MWVLAICALVVLAAPLPIVAQQRAKTEEGRDVLLYVDGTWKYVERTTESRGVADTREQEVQAPNGLAFSWKSRILTEKANEGTTANFIGMATNKTGQYWAMARFCIGIVGTGGKPIPCAMEIIARDWEPGRSLVFEEKTKVLPTTEVSEYLIGFMEGNNQRVTPTPSPAGIQEAQLALLSSRGYKEYDYSIVEGQVRNTSSRSIQSIVAVVTWYDDNDNFVTSESALIEYDPLVAGETSTFKVMSRTPASARRYSIDFKRFGSGSIRWDDRRK